MGSTFFILHLVWNLYCVYGITHAFLVLRPREIVDIEYLAMNKGLKGIRDYY